MKKEVFDGLEDPFVYEIYLEVLAAQAQFEEMFARPRGSVKHWAISDLTNYLFVPYNMIENIKDYLKRREESSENRQTFSFNN